MCVCVCVFNLYIIIHTYMHEFLKCCIHVWARGICEFCTQMAEAGCPWNWGMWVLGTGPHPVEDQ